MTNRVTSKFNGHTTSHLTKSLYFDNLNHHRNTNLNNTIRLQSSGVWCCVVGYKPVASIFRRRQQVHPKPRCLSAKIQDVAPLKTAVRISDLKMIDKTEHLLTEQPAASGSSQRLMYLELVWYVLIVWDTQINQDEGSGLCGGDEFLVAAVGAFTHSYLSLQQSNE